MKKMGCIIAIASVLAVVVQSQGATVRRLVLSPQCKVKMRIALSAVEDLDSLANKDVYEMAHADAQRAMRESDALANTKDERLASEEIAVYLLDKEACRPAPTTKEYQDCDDAARAHDKQIRFELGLVR